MSPGPGRGERSKNDLVSAGDEKSPPAVLERAKRQEGLGGGDRATAGGLQSIIRKNPARRRVSV